jgi:hypothetical protein
MMTGLDRKHGINSDTDEHELAQAQRRHKTLGQHFKLRVMDALFNSPFSMVEHCP